MIHDHRPNAGEPPRWSNASRTLVALALALALTAGCAGSRRAVDTSLKYLESKAAYEQSCPPQLPHTFQRHYERGWRCGYMTVAKGRKPCPPAVPPQQYWSHKYQSAEGRQFIVTWYDGWRAGAECASGFGIDNCYRVPAIHTDCDCRTACNFPTSGVLPNPETVANVGAGSRVNTAFPPRSESPVPLPPVTKTVGDGDGDDKASSNRAEQLAPPPAD